MAARLSDLAQDVSYGLRMLAKEPGLTLAAVLSIAIGVAANTTVFTVANKLLFQGLPVGDPGSLVSLYGHRKGDRPGETLSWPDFQDLRAEKRVLRDAAAVFPLVPAGLAKSDGTARRLWGQLVTGNYFDVAGVRPARGRGFLPEEDQAPGRSFVVVLAYHCWQRHFGSDPAIVGQPIKLNQRTLEVVGVAPRGFRGTETGLVADFWVPISLYRQMAPGLKTEMMAPDTRNHLWLFAIGRLVDGVSVREAQAAIDTVGKRLEREYTASNRDRGFYAEQAGKLNPALRDSAVSLLALLLVVMSLVLLIACANVANLMLARAAKRHREIATRLAIGAARGRLIRQFLTESLLLAAFGTLAALLLAQWALALIAGLRLPFPVPVDFSTSFDGRVALFTLGLTLLTSLAFGLAPAMRATRTDLVSSLRVQTADTQKPRRLRLASVLVVGQVAVAMVLLTGAVLVLRSLQNAHTIGLGFEPRNLLLVTVDPAVEGIEPGRTVDMLHTLQERLSGLAGVETVSYTDIPQLSMIGSSGTILTEQQKTRNEPSPVSPDLYLVGDRYLEAMRIPLRQGSGALRTKAAGGDVPAIVSETLAAKLFGNRNPVGEKIYRKHLRFEVVGVAAQSKSRTVGEAPRPMLYSLLDRTYAGDTFLGIHLLIRTKAAPAAMAVAVRREMRVVYPNLSIFDVETMEEHVANAQLLPRVAAALFGFAGATALILALTGLYGVINYGVNRRVREIGIRMALGAGSRAVLGMVLKQGLRLALTGGVLGFALAWGLTRILAGLLYGISPTDPATFALVPAVLVGTALAATLAPATRASRLEPSAALREE